MLKQLLDRPLWHLNALMFLLGITAGVLGGANTTVWAKPFGDLYLNLMRMIVVPLIFVSVTASLGRMRATTQAVRLFVKTIFWFLVTSACAIGVGMAFALMFTPGLGVGDLMVENIDTKEIPSLVLVLLNIVPSNPLRALADGNLLQVLFVASLTGAALYSIGDKGKDVQNLLEQCEAVTFRLVRFIVKLSPLGTFGLIASVVGHYGLSSLVPLGKFIGVLYAACIFHMVVVYGGLLKLHGLSALKFFRSVFPAQQMAFVTTSSMATLPLSLRTSTDKLGIDKNYASFALPLGASVKMDGCGAIYPAIATIFIAHYFGLTLTNTHYLLIGVSTLLGSFATAGVPGTSLVMLTFTLSSAGLPLEGIGYLIAVDRIVDMMRTATNVTGQMLVAVLVAREEGMLNTVIYDRIPVLEGEERPAI